MAKYSSLGKVKLSLTNLGFFIFGASAGFAGSAGLAFAGTFGFATVLALAALVAVGVVFFAAAFLTGRRTDFLAVAVTG